MSERSERLVEHRPHVGKEYVHGIKGRRIAIIGYSHYGWPDDDDMSEEVVEKFIAGEYKDLSFFWSIASYFGFTDVSFWDRVMFFNFVPSSVGNPSDRYKHGTPEQMAIGRDRFSRLLLQHEPDVAFVFTKKARWAMPDLRWRPVEGVGLDIEEGADRIGITKVVRLRHPQGARWQVMKDAVDKVLDEVSRSAAAPRIPGE